MAALSREQLVRLLLREEELSTLTESHGTPAAGTSAAGVNVANVSGMGESTASPHATTQSSAGAESLSALEHPPERDPEEDEALRYSEQMLNLSDDVNALSISVRRKASYVGVSSISAALEVMFKIEPSARAYMAQTHTETTNPSRRNSQTQFSLGLNMDPTALPPPDIGQRLIESYFNHVHPLMPMIDEQEFWHMYLYTNRKDTPWLALLNIVLALGAVASPTSNNTDHLIFSHRVRAQFSLELFGSGNLFVLQALGLLTGYYLHWLSRPNEANALMGAALRMAISMGLHREFSTSPTPGAAEIPVEIRRRTWWSLVCLDTWSAMTTGRPSLGRLGQGITVEAPKIPDQTNNAQYLASLKLLFIVHNVKFCKLATQVQDKMASMNILPAAELNILDAELVQWHEDLPPVLHKPTSSRSRFSSVVSAHGNEASITPESTNDDCPEQLKTPRLVLYWWYMTLRVLAHRPVLLASALRRLPFDNLLEEEQAIVAKCRRLAGQTIEHIDQACPDDMIATWTAVWLMYQAVMVPLVSLFLHTSLQRTSNLAAASEDEVEMWRRQVEIAIAWYGRRDVNISQRCKVMLQKLYDANRSAQQTIALPSDPSTSDSQWYPKPNVRSIRQLPSANDDIEGLAGDMNLDEWLQTYDAPLDASTAWGDMNWSGAEVIDETLLQGFHYSSSRPPADYTMEVHPFY